MTNSNQAPRIPRTNGYFIERRLKALLAKPQPDDELGIRRAKILAERQGWQWFRLVSATITYRLWRLHPEYRMKSWQADNPDITVEEVEAIYRGDLKDAIEAVWEWVPKNTGKRQPQAVSGKPEEAENSRSRDMVKIISTVADSPDDPIYNGGFVISSHTANPESKPLKTSSLPSTESKT